MIPFTPLGSGVHVFISTVPPSSLVSTAIPSLTKRKETVILYSLQVRRFSPLQSDGACASKHISTKKEISIIVDLYGQQSNGQYLHNFRSNGHALPRKMPSRILPKKEFACAFEVIMRTC